MDLKFCKQALDGLKRLGFENWKSVEQGMAVSCILEGIKDVVIILPTGKLAQYSRVTLRY